MKTLSCQRKDINKEIEIILFFLKKGPNMNVKSEIFSKFELEIWYTPWRGVCPREKETEKETGKGKGETGKGNRRRDALLTSS